MLMVIYHFVERVGELSLPPIFHTTHMIMKNNIQVNQSIYIYKALINMIQENNLVLSPKKGQGKLILFCGNGERVFPIYAIEAFIYVVI